ncbi:hypothetical protein IH982_03145 [Patescibacteria group bacterium]|nr:hypothetical protein [Patescibacteria group bacterium]
MEIATLDQATKILAHFKDEPRDQVQALIESGLLADLRDANFNEEIDRDAVRKLLGLKPLNQPFLEEGGTAMIPATTEQFVVREKFVRGNTLFLGMNFEGWFEGKTEEAVMETELRYATLTGSLVGRPILAELGDKAETTLAQIWALMERQPNGEEGVLLTGGWENVFYVRDVNGELRVVYVSRGGSSWLVDADLATRMRSLSVGYRVFSRNS